LSADRVERRRPVLLLFDIDGTLLLRASDAHRDAIHHGLREIYGIADPAGIAIRSPAGRTDSEIARELLAAAGGDPAEFDGRLEEFRRACAASFERACPASLAAHVAPGIADLLDGLGGTRLALVTGNYEPIARLKLARAGIGHHFDAGQGGFGSDAEERGLLPAIARRRAGGAGGEPHPRERTIVIGDTPRDIACARADGVRVLAVATGPYAAYALSEADGVAADGFELRELLGRELAG
jgi:phosphoglycolate phosphatase-like HAD superfamily hydrolase